MSHRKVWGFIAVSLWVVTILVLVVIGLGTFIAPKIVRQIQSRGQQELPVSWQIIVDLGDFSRNRWFVVFPGLIVGAILASRAAIVKQSRRS